MCVPEGGLEPPIFGLGDRRLIHWATRAPIMPNHQNSPPHLPPSPLSLTTNFSKLRPNFLAPVSSENCAFVKGSSLSAGREFKFQGRSSGVHVGCYGGSSSSSHRVCYADTTTTFRGCLELPTLFLFCTISHSLNTGC